MKIPTTQEYNMERHNASKTSQHRHFHRHRQTLACTLAQAHGRLLSRVLQHHTLPTGCFMGKQRSWRLHASAHDPIYYRARTNAQKAKTQSLSRLSDANASSLDRAKRCKALNLCRATYTWYLRTSPCVCLAHTRAQN